MPSFKTKRGILIWRRREREAVKLFKGVLRSQNRKNTSLPLPKNLTEIVNVLDLKAIIGKSFLSLMEVCVLILSAGKGQRMKSAFPKGLHPVGGKPILARVLRAVTSAGFKDIKVITTEESQNLTLPIIRSFKAESVIQKSRPGTAGAVMALPPRQPEPLLPYYQRRSPLDHQRRFKNFF